MEKGIADAIEQLKAQGITVEVDAAGGQADHYVATVPDGEKYRFNATGLLNLKAEQRLHVEGLQEIHLAKKDTPDLR